MTNSKITTRRRTAIQQLTLVTAGLSLFSLAGCDPTKKQLWQITTTNCYRHFICPQQQHYNQGQVELIFGC